jgi:hypothetical protein
MTTTGSTSTARSVLTQPAPPQGTDESPDERRRRLLAMLPFGLWTVNTKMTSYDEGFARFWRHRAIKDELG